jgi:hypothetical protein
MYKMIQISALSGALLLSSAMSLAAPANNAVNSLDKLNLEGKYNCTGFDSHDGAFTGVITMKLDAKASDFEHNFGAYQFTLVEGGEGTGSNSYKGEAVAHGDELAIYFQNNNDKTALGRSDFGVGIASVTHDRDDKGNVITTLHKFYYGPNYVRDKKGPTGNFGGLGNETCVKVSF